MHGAGSKEPVMNVDIVKRFIKAGADVDSCSSRFGTVPRAYRRELVEIVKVAHANDALVLSAIEQAKKVLQREVTEQIPSVISGCVDIHHIGTWDTAV